jgi:hypothetical protein
MAAWTAAALGGGGDAGGLGRGGGDDGGFFGFHRPGGQKIEASRRFAHGPLKRQIRAGLEAAGEVLQLGGGEAQSHRAAGHGGRDGVAVEEGIVGTQPIRGQQPLAQGLLPPSGARSGVGPVRSLGTFRPAW